ncbi:hypothetical protein DFH06DRAFT_1091032, partial [Mycena polygramma]
MTSGIHKAATIAHLQLSDPPAHLSSTNNPPSESEQSESRLIINRGRVHAANLRTEVDRLQTALDAHRLELTNVLEKIDQHSKIISPLRRLPPEMLEEIFRHTLSALSAYDDSPWNISRVCGRWRNISLASPFLW